MSQTPPKAKEGIKEQVDKLLNIENLIDEDDYYQGIDVNKLDVLSDKLVALFQEQVKEIIGEDEKASFDDKYKAMYFGVRNQLRDEQRKLQERYL